MRLEKLYEMSFTKIYGLLLDKVERKGRTKDELNQVITWLCGYSSADIESILTKDVSYAEFFYFAPKMNENRFNVNGKICGVRIEEISDPLYRDIRILDKLVDELAKGKKYENIIK